MCGHNVYEDPYAETDNEIDYSQYMFGHTSNRINKTSTQASSSEEQQMRHDEGNARKAMQQEEWERRFYNLEVRMHEAVLARFPRGTLLEKYHTLLQEKSVPEAILELAQDHGHSFNEILVNWAHYSGYDYEDVIRFDFFSTADSRLLHFYVNTWNKQISAKINAPNSDHLALLKNIKSRFSVLGSEDADDDECSAFYIRKSILNQFKNFRLYYVANLNTVIHLPECVCLDKMFNLAMQIYSFGLYDEDSGLFALFGKHRFSAITLSCGKTKTDKQHLWMHPVFPLQVRIKDSGELTIGIIKKNALYLGGVLTADNTSVSNEFLKINTIQQALPSGFKNNKLKKYWRNGGVKQSIKDSLMAKAHKKIRVSNRIFNLSTDELNTISGHLAW